MLCLHKVPVIQGFCLTTGRGTD